MIKKYPNPNPNGRALVDCAICGERKEHSAKGMCKHCYKKQYVPKTIICVSCNRKTPHHAKGMCKTCHMRLFHYNKILDYNARKKFGISIEKYQELTKTCASCGFSKIVELHHLDANKENNAESNLAPLCPNCHKMIHHHEFYEEILQNLSAKYEIINYRPRRLNNEYGKTLY